MGIPVGRDGPLPSVATRGYLEDGALSRKGIMDWPFRAEAKQRTDSEDLRTRHSSMSDASPNHGQAKAHYALLKASNSRSIW
jgi:hypothetical protein